MKKQSTAVRKEQLIRATLKIIHAEGVENLSVARLSAELGLVPSALYRHYKSKDEVLNAVLDYIASRIQNNLREVFERTDDPVERLHLLLDRQTRLIKASPALPKVLFSYGIFSEDEHRRAKVQGILFNFKSELEAIIRSAQQEGGIRADVPPETLALMLIGLFQPAAFFFHLTRGRYDPVLHGKRAWSLYREMLRPERTKVK